MGESTGLSMCPPFYSHCVFLLRFSDDLGTTAQPRLIDIAWEEELDSAEGRGTPGWPMPVALPMRFWAQLQWRK